MSGNPSQDADCVLQLFYPFREKLSSYRGYKVLGEDGMKGVLRSVIISKNRYGVANQVICLGFWGSVGWWKELPQPDEIKDFTFFLDERKNILYFRNRNLENLVHAQHYQTHCVLI